MSQAWVSAQASLPNGWQLTGLMRFGEEWLALSNGPAADQHIEASGRYAEQALQRLSQALRRQRGSVSG